MSSHIKMHNSSNLNQQLNLAPQLLNWLKILQVSSLDLTEMVNTELATNPALESSIPEESDYQDDYSEDSYDADSSEMQLDQSEMGERLSVLAEIDEEWRTGDAQPEVSSSVLQDKHDFMMDHLVKASSLSDELDEVIRFSELSQMDKEIAHIISGSLDFRGYLDASIDDIAMQAGVTNEEVLSALEHFQALAPAGIGARDFRECLILQLKAMPHNTELAQILVADWLDNLAMHQEAAIASFLKVDFDDVVASLELIRTLDPEPGRSFQTENVEYVEADMEITAKGGELQVTLLDERLPRLQLSSYCKRLLDARKGSKEDLDYIRTKIREASFLIQGIGQRQETMLKVAKQIIRVQHEYLSSDDGQLRPLTMNKVAAMIGVHETTVSRAIANKYIQTQRGLIEMRAFFKVGYRCADGSSVTPERVKKQLAALISAEDELKPLTDAHISERFKKQGLKVARRTVAKYREELAIPSSKERLSATKRRLSRKEAVAV